MAKISWKPGTLSYPLPPVMVSCGTVENPNIITVAWTGIVSSEPPTTYVSIRPSRHSHKIIKESGEFVINLTTLPLVTAADYCGVKSGKDIDKFKEMNLTPGACSQVAAPQIVESPISIECKVTGITNHGSHDMFLAEIVAVNVDDKYIDKDGKLTLEKAGLIAYAHNYYYTLGRNVGFFGFSVCKSALKAKERMANVVVEIKEPKIAKTEKTDKFAKKNVRRKDEGDRKPRGKDFERPRKKFDGKDKFEKSRREDKDFDKPRKPRDDERSERRSFDDKPRRPRDGERSERRSFDDKPRRPRGDGERSFGDRPRKPREGERSERRPSFGDKPRKPRGDGERSERRSSFGDKPRAPRDGERSERRSSFGDRPRKPRDGERSERRPSSGGGSRRPSFRK